MRITVQHALKIPDAEPYSSRQHSVALELDVPEDVVAKGKDAIREYAAKVTAEVRSYVEEALADVRTEQQEREPEPVPPAPRTAPPAAHRPAAYGSAPGRPAARARPGGASPSAAGGASIKQLNYLRSLAAEAGYSPDQLAYLAQEVVGKDDVRSLSKKDASALIDQLRGGQQ